MCFKSCYLRKRYAIWKLMLCLKSRTYVSALKLSALNYPYSTLTYRRSALISKVHGQDSLRSTTGNEFAV